jgi:hypothetical protein
MDAAGYAPLILVEAVILRVVAALVMHALWLLQSAEQEKEDAVFGMRAGVRHKRRHYDLSKATSVCFVPRSSNEGGGGD